MSLAGEFTRRQRDVIALVTLGKSNKEIARALNLTEGTVKTHLHKLYKALTVSNRTALTSILLRK